MASRADTKPILPKEIKTKTPTHQNPSSGFPHLSSRVRARKTSAALRSTTQKTHPGISKLRPRSDSIFWKLVPDAPKATSTGVPFCTPNIQVDSHGVTRAARAYSDSENKFYLSLYVHLCQLEKMPTRQELAKVLIDPLADTPLVHPMLGPDSQTYDLNAYRQNPDEYHKHWGLADGGGASDYTPRVNHVLVYICDYTAGLVPKTSEAATLLKLAPVKSIAKNPPYLDPSAGVDLNGNPIPQPSSLVTGFVPNHTYRQALGILCQDKTLQRTETRESIQQLLIDPISGEQIYVPIIGPDGKTYSQDSFRQHKRKYQGIWRTKGYGNHPFYESPPKNQVVQELADWAYQVDEDLVIEADLANETVPKRPTSAQSTDSGITYVGEEIESRPDSRIKGDESNIDSDEIPEELN